MKKKYSLILSIILILVMSHAILYSISYGLLHWESDILNGGTRDYISICSLILVMVAVILFCIKYYRINFKTEPKGFTLKILMILFLVAISTHISYLSYSFFFKVLKGEKILFDFNWPNSRPTYTFLYVIAMVVVGPIAEEVLFRKVFFARLKQYYPLGISIIISSLFFALHHLDIYSFFPQFLIGVLLAYIYHIMKSLFLVIFCHSLLNLFMIFSNLQEVDHQANIPILESIVILGSYIGLFFGIKSLYKQSFS